MTVTNDRTLVDADVEQHSLVKSTILHLLPGGLMLVFFIIAAPLVDHMGIPPSVGYTLAVLFVQIPFEMGLLYTLGKKRNGRYSLQGIVLYRERMPVWQMIGLAVACMIWLFVILYIVFKPVDNVIIENLFAWLPDWFFPERSMENPQRYSNAGLLLALVLMWIAAVPGSLVEELYFRDYLLPRLSRLGKWSPLVNDVLFSLEHLTQPWQNPGRIVALLPMTVAVWWKKNLTLGIIVHSGAVVLGFLFQMIGILALMFGWM